jgi:hypothetical protein
MALHDKHIPWPVSAGVVALCILPLAAIVDNASGAFLKPIRYDIYAALVLTSIFTVVGCAILFVFFIVGDINLPGILIEKGKAHLLISVLAVAVTAICIHVAYKMEVNKTKTVKYIEVDFTKNPNAKTSFTKNTLFSTMDGVVDCAKLFEIEKINNVEKRNFSLIETRYYSSYGISPRVDFEYALVELPMGVEKIQDGTETSNLVILRKKELSLQ